MRRASLLPLLLLLLTFASVSKASASDDQMERQTLKGLKTIYVAVDLSPEVVQNGLSQEQVQTDAELKLRMTGIHVLSKEEALNAHKFIGLLHLVVDVYNHPSLPTTFAFKTEITLEQAILLSRDNNIRSIAPTWSTSELGIVGSARMSTVRDEMKDLIDTFCNAYLAANPR